MNKKFRLTKTTKKYSGIILYQIEALKGFGEVNKGDKGGFIEKEDNLSQEGNAWVSGNARVYGNAWVSGDAWVYGDAQVSGDAWVYGDARVYGDLKLTGGYFYHYKKTSEEIEKVEVNADYEILCREPKFAEDTKTGKRVKIKVKDQIIEGELVEE